MAPLVGPAADGRSTQRGVHQPHLGAAHQCLNVGQDEHALRVAASDAAHAHDVAGIHRGPLAVAYDGSRQSRRESWQ
jgi:hypothetical protein